MRVFLIGLVSFVLTYSFVKAITGHSDNVAKSPQSVKTYTQMSQSERNYHNENWMWAGREAVKAKLKDSGSAKFQHLYVNRGKDNIPVTCGQVNSKNSFGAYGGWQRFISAGKPELTFLEEQVDDFHKAWNQFCA